MVMLNLNTRDAEFANASQDSDFPPLPDGEYIAQIVNSEKRTLKSGSETLVFTWLVIDGEYRNRKIFENLYIYDPTRPKQLAFNKQKLFFITKACGRDSINDTVELHNKPCRITVRQHEYNGKTRNEISAYRPITRITETQPQAASQKTDTFDGDMPF